MPESLQTKLTRWGFNMYPVYFGTGGTITYIAADWREIRVKLALSWRTNNYVGSIFGGSIYSAVDPFYMIMLIKNLGPDYIVWDKSAAIRFKKPGRSALHARFLLTDDELQAIRQATSQTRAIDRHYLIQLTDADGEVCAEVDKTIYIRRKNGPG